MSKFEKYISKFINADTAANFRIMRGFVYVAFFVLIGKVIAALREVVIADKFGVSETVDVYIFAFVLISWLPVAWAGILNTVYVPLVHRISKDERTIFDKQLHWYVIFSAFILSTVMMVVLPWVVPYIAGQMSPDSQALLKQIFVQMGIVSGFGLVAAFYSAILLSAELHSNTLVEAVPPIIVLFLVLIWAVPESVAPLVLGTVVGAILQTGILFYLLKSNELAPKVSVRSKSDKWAEFKKALGWLALSQFILSMIMPFDQILAARLDAGSVSVMSYANRLLALALGLGVTAISRAVLPVLSDTSIDFSKRKTIAYQWFVGMLLLGAVSLIVGWLLAPWMVKLLFERGAFTPENTRSVAEAVRFGLFQIPFYFSSIVIVQLFASMGAYRFLIISAFIGFFVKVSTGPVLAERYGVNGIMLSTSLMYAINAGFLFVSQLRYKHDPNAVKKTSK